jgi:hypothetical protein
LGSVSFSSCVTKLRSHRCPASSSCRSRQVVRSALRRNGPMSRRHSVLLPTPSRCGAAPARAVVRKKTKNKRQRFEDGFEAISISNDVYQGSSVYMSKSYPIHKLPLVEPSKIQNRHAFIDLPLSAHHQHRQHLHPPLHHPLHLQFLLIYQHHQLRSHSK